MPRSTKTKNSPANFAHRLSFSFTPDQHEQLLEIASRNKVSVAWVVRVAIESLLRDEQPLFHVGQSR